jgi:hypothetical protein
MTKQVIDVAADGYEVLEVSHREVRHTRVQDSSRYLAENKFWRDNIDKGAATRNWAMPIGQIPYSDYQLLVKANPDLSSGDNEIRTKAWLALLRSGAGELLRTVRKQLVPDSLTPDKGSIIVPGKLYKNSDVLSRAYAEGASGVGANPHVAGSPAALAWDTGDADLTGAEYSGVANGFPTLTTSRLAALTTAQISSLTAAQLKSLDGPQLGALSTVQLNALSTQQTQSLSPVHLSELATTELAALAPSKIAVLTSSQLSMLTTAQLGSLSTAQLDAIKPQVIPALTTKQVASLTTDKIANLETAQIVALSLTQLAAWSTAQVAALSTTQLTALTTTQLAALAT